MDSSKILGFPPSRCAPARKSAQIISRQYPRALSDPSMRAAVSRHIAEFAARDKEGLLAKLNGFVQQAGAA